MQAKLDNAHEQLLRVEAACSSRTRALQEAIEELQDGGTRAT